MEAHNYRVEFSEKNHELREAIADIHPSKNLVSSFGAEQ
jgi:hypothetical protein